MQVSVMSTKKRITGRSFSQLIPDERVLRSERSFAGAGPRANSFLVRAKLVPREQKGNRKNQENGKCIRRRVGKSRNKRSEAEVRKFFISCSLFALSFASMEVYFCLIAGETDL